MSATSERVLPLILDARRALHEAQPRSPSRSAPGR